MDCGLFILFNIVMTALIVGGVVTLAGKGQMEVAGVTITLGSGFILLIGLWLAFFLLC